jgi:hypothetical protein
METQNSEKERARVKRDSKSWFYRMADSLAILLDEAKQSCDQLSS